MNRSIMLGIHGLQSIPIGLVEDERSMVTIITTAVNLQFQAKIPWPFPVEDRLGLVAVVFDHRIPYLTALIATPAQRFVIVIMVIRVIQVDDPPAIVTAGIEPFVTGFT